MSAQLIVYGPGRARPLLSRKKAYKALTACKARTKHEKAPRADESIDIGAYSFERKAFPVVYRNGEQSPEFHWIPFKIQKKGKQPWVLVDARGTEIDRYHG